MWTQKELQGCNSFHDFYSSHVHRSWRPTLIDPLGPSPPSRSSRPSLVAAATMEITCTFLFEWIKFYWDATASKSHLCLLCPALPSWNPARVASAAPPTGRRCRTRGRCGCRRPAARGHPRHPPLGTEASWGSCSTPVCGPAARPDTKHWTLDKKVYRVAGLSCPEVALSK